MGSTTPCGERRHESLDDPIASGLVWFSLPRQLWKRVTKLLHSDDLYAFARACRFFRALQVDHIDQQAAAHETKSMSSSSSSLLSKKKAMLLEGFRTSNKTTSLRTRVYNWRDESGRSRKVTRSYLEFAHDDPKSVVEKEDQWERRRSDTLNAAAMHGYAELVHRWAEEGTKVGWKTCEACCKGGQVGILRWLREIRDPPCPWRKSFSTFNEAARGGHLECCEYLLDQGCPWEDDGYTMTAAAEGGHLEVLKWLRSRDPPCNWEVSGATCLAAIRGGHLESLEFLRREGCPWDREKGMRVARTRKHVRVLRWIEKN